MKKLETPAPAYCATIPLIKLSQLAQPACYLVFCIHVQPLVQVIGSWATPTLRPKGFPCLGPEGLPTWRAPGAGVWNTFLKKNLLPWLRNLETHLQSDNFTPAIKKCGKTSTQGKFAPVIAEITKTLMHRSFCSCWYKNDKTRTLGQFCPYGQRNWRSMHNGQIYPCG